MPLSPEVTRINPNGVTQLSKDVHFLTDFVGSLENAFMLEQNLDELQQTVALMESDNHDEFFDISTRNKKYGRVDAMNGPILLEKYVWSLETFDVLQNTNRPSQTYPHGRDTDQDRPGTDIVELLLALRPEVNRLRLLYHHRAFPADTLAAFFWIPQEILGTNRSFGVGPRSRSEKLVILISGNSS